MNLPYRQEDLFAEEALIDKNTSLNGESIPISKSLLKAWHQQISAYQAELFTGKGRGPKQYSLFDDNDIKVEKFNPLKLTPLPINFWRWPSSAQNGPAIYLVMDQPEHLDSHILLYIGETIAAERRWKGEHDCKSYLSSYSEVLSSTGVKSQLSIRFWMDVPEETTSRRKLEQLLIRKWLPPFNKETRARWSTPFTAEIK